MLAIHRTVEVSHLVFGNGWCRKIKAAAEEARTSSSVAPVKDSLDLGNLLPAEICSIYRKKGISKLYPWQWIIMVHPRKRRSRKNATGALHLHDETVEPQIGDDMMSQHQDGSSHFEEGSKRKRVDPQQWKVLVNYWRTPEAAVDSSSRNQSNRRKQKMPHTAGTTCFAWIREEEGVDGYDPNITWSSDHAQH